MRVHESQPATRNEPSPLQSHANAQAKNSGPRPAAPIQAALLARPAPQPSHPGATQTHAAALNRATGAGLERTGHLLLQLQRQYGNRYVQRVLAVARQAQQTTEVAPEVEQTIERSRGAGQPLDSGVRAQMELALGADFSAVRLHTDATADALSQALQARAFTTGRDLFFRQGEYNPSSSGGRKLLAHELAHVVQQSGARIQAKLSVSQPGDSGEREADWVAQQVTQSAKPEGGQHPGISGAVPGGTIQRMCADCSCDDHQRQEAAFDDEPGDDVKTEVEITWGAPTYTSDRSAAASMAQNDQVKTQAGLSWPAADYSSDAAGGSSTTVEKPFTVAYSAVEDAPSNTWKLKVDSISGGATIRVHTGGSTDPIASPPTTEADAKSAVTVMKGYYARGSRGAWHTEAASSSHENYHYSEWQCSAGHYWPATRTAIEGLAVSKNDHANAASAVAAMKAGAGGADAKIAAFQRKARDYWFTLPDNASSRPYAAGQLTLNTAIISVQTLAAAKGWTVAAGTDSPSTANPCFKPWI
jgi:Domain of unknown function (DUF4157)